MLLVNTQGLITAANASALALWQVSESELIGEAFSSLFYIEVISESADLLEAQWEVALATTLDRGAILGIQPREGAPFDQLVRLEPALGAASGYIAVVQNPPVTSANPAARDDGLSLLLEHNVAGFFDLNFKAGRIFYSAAWKKLLGYVDAELPNHQETWSKAIHPEDSDAAPFFPGRKHPAGIRRINVEFRMQHRRGDYVWLQCTGLQQVGEAGEFERVTGFCLDVTERRELEETSLTNDARLQGLGGANGPLGAFEFDFANESHWLSEGWCRLLGYDAATAQANPVASFGRSLPAGEAADGLESWFLNRAPGCTTFVEPATLRAADGRLVPVLLGAHRILSRKRDLVRIIGFICELPEDAALALPGSHSTPNAARSGAALDEALVTEAFATMAEAILVTDTQGQILFANPAAARLLRSSAATLIGTPLADVFRLVNRLSGRPGDDPIERAIAAENPLPLIVEHSLIFSDASAAAVPIVWTARASYGPDHKPRGAIVVFRDPDELTLTPDELVKANRLESLGLLAGGIAHDFNNILGSILGYAGLALQRFGNSSPPKLTEYLKEVVGAGERRVEALEKVVVELDVVFQDQRGLVR